MDVRKIILSVVLITVLFLSGCISVDVEQKLKRNGHYDIDLTISTSQEYKMVLSGLKEGFQVHDSVQDKFVYSETDTSITYSFTDIDPEEDTALFKPPEKQEFGTDSILGESQEMPDSTFLDPENIEFDKEFKFPYYEFTYKLTIVPESEKSDSATLSAADYILDEANLLNEESKNQMMEDINDVYRNDSIEILIVTRMQMTSIDYSSSKYNIIRDFDFKKDNEKYVLVFASTNSDGLCKVESNFYSDRELSTKIRTLDDEFSKNCRTSYSGQIRNVVSELKSYSETIDVEISDDISNQMSQLFKIGYTVDIFGTIVETNGLKMGDDRIKFDVNPYEGGEYTVVFKDFFLATILGDLYWLYFLLLVVVVVGGIGLVVTKKIRAGHRSETPQAPLAIDPQVVEYVKRARAGGMTDEQIKGALMQSGWSAQVVDVALKSA